MSHLGFLSGTLRGSESPTPAERNSRALRKWLFTPLHNFIRFNSTTISRPYRTTTKLLQASKDCRDIVRKGHPTLHAHIAGLRCRDFGTAHKLIPRSPPLLRAKTRAVREARDMTEYTQLSPFPPNHQRWPCLLVIWSSWTSLRGRR